MGRATLVWAIVGGSVAFAAAADLPPIVIAPFRNRCFDAAGLAERVRSQVPGVPVSVGTPPAAAHQQVRVSGDDRQVTVRLEVRNQRQQVVGSDERLLALGDDCAAIAETAALIIVRAATPLAFRTPPPVRRPPKPSENRPPPVSENRPSENRPPPVSENRPPAVSENRPPPVSENRPPAVSENRPPVSENRPPESRPPAVSENRPPATRRGRRLEIDVVALWTFPLDGPPSTPAGDLTVGWRWRLGKRLQLGVGLRVGVSGEWTATTMSAQGPITVSARRIPLSAELRVDLDVPLGVVRISAGPEVPIWVAGSSGIPRPGSAVFAQPGAFVRVAYRLELGPVMVEAGLALSAAFIRDDLAVGGVGPVGQTPVVMLSPFAGAGVGFF